MNIDSIKRFVLAGLVVIGAGLSVPAVAQSYRGGGYHGGGYHGGGNYYHGGGGYYRGGGYHGGGWYGNGAWWGLGIGLGVGYAAATYANSYYYPAYYYPAPGYYYPSTAYYPVAQPAPAVDPYYSQPVSEPATAAPPPMSQASNWYYCVPTKGYYPNVRQCSEPWRIVPATPPGPIN